jgi:dihydroxyacetone synthase
MPHLVETGHPAGLNKPKIITEDVSGLKSSSNINSAAGAQTNGLSAVPSSKLTGWREDLTEDDYAVLALRNLLFDICNQNGGGHGGSAIGMAAIGVALWKYTMRYNPSDPEWFDRDRFVLSNGECSWADDTISHGIWWADH